jgi:hypothetical protein
MELKVSLKENIEFTSSISIPGSVSDIVDPFFDGIHESRFV